LRNLDPQMVELVSELWLCLCRRPLLWKNGPTHVCVEETTENTDGEHFRETIVRALTTNVGNVRPICSHATTKKEELSHRLRKLRVPVRPVVVATRRDIEPDRPQMSAGARASPSWIGGRRRPTRHQYAARLPIRHSHRSFNGSVACLHGCHAYRAYDRRSLRSGWREGLAWILRRGFRSCAQGRRDSLRKSQPFIRPSPRNSRFLPGQYRVR
jgi:hypothetical protein